VNFGPVTPEFQRGKKNFLAHMHGLYVLLALISFFFNDPLSFKQSGLRIYIGPIFTKFSPCGVYLIADYRSDRLFDRSRDVAMATNFRVQMSKIGRLIFIRRLGIPKRLGISIF